MTETDRRDTGEDAAHDREQVDGRSVERIFATDGGAETVGRDGGDVPDRTDAAWSDSPHGRAVAVTPTDVDDLLAATETGGLQGYNYAYLDEHTKREVRRSVLAAIAIPGHQVPFASREMPLARGWGTGGIQVSLSLLGPDDTFKVIDQGSDESVNAANIRRLAATTADVDTTTDTTEASVIQTRHRIPEEAMTAEQILVLQVPVTDPLRSVDGSDDRNRRRHAHGNYSKMWVALYENVVEYGEIQIGAAYPVLVGGRYLTSPSPIPRWDTPKLDQAETLFLFAAGREARIYAVPPHTDVEPLAFDDRQFQIERLDQPCVACGSTDTFVTEVETDDGRRQYACNDTSFCEKRQRDPGLSFDHHLDRTVEWGPTDGSRPARGRAVRTDGTVGTNGAAGTDAADPVEDGDGDDGDGEEDDGAGDAEPVDSADDGDGDADDGGDDP